MKRSTKQLLSLLLTIVMVLSLMAPALATASVTDEVAEAPEDQAVLLATPQTFKVTADTDVSAAATASTAVTTGVDGVTLTLLKNAFTVGSETSALDAGEYGSYSHYIKDGSNPAKDGTNLKTTDAEQAVVPDAGAAYQFSVTEDGALSVVYRLDNKVLRVVKSDDAAGTNATMEYTTGAVATRKPGVYTIDAKAGKVYTIYAVGSKLGLAGFVFEAGASVDKTPVITVSSPEAGDDALTVNTTVGASKGLVVSADISNAEVTALKYTWYKAAGATAAPATDTKVQDPATTNSATYTIAADNEVTGEKYYCVVSAEGADSVTSEMFTVTVAPAQQEEDPGDDELVGGTWEAKLENIPGNVTVTKLGDWGQEFTEETKVTTAITALDFYVGGDKYKVIENKDVDGHTTETIVGMTGNGNASGCTTDKPIPSTGKGTYYKWVAKTDGVLQVKAINNGSATDGKAIFVAKNGTCLEGYAGTLQYPKTLNEFAVPVAEGDTVTLAVGGSKAQLVSFTFAVTKTVGGTWEAKLENIPGNITVTKLGDWGQEFTEETLVEKTGVTGLKFYVGGDKYKVIENKDVDGHTTETIVGMTGNGNASGCTTDKPIPSTGKGTYYKWVAEEDGVLTVKAINNGSATDGKAIFVAKNGVCLEGYAGTLQYPKTLNEITVTMVKDDVVTLAVGGSKAQLVSFSYSGGGGVEEVTADWTKAAICVNGAITVTPTAKTDGTITVAVAGPRVGTVTDLAAGTITKYADAVDVVMYQGDTEVATVSNTNPGNTRTVTFKPTASGSYTFKALVKRNGESATIDSDKSAAVDFVLPLAKPVVSVDIQNGGKLGVNWAKVPEATAYKVYMADSQAGLASATAIDVTTNSYTTDALTVGSTYWFQVEAIRGADTSAKSDAVSQTAAAEAKTVWNYTYYGTSTTKWDDKQNAGNDSNLFDVYPDGVIKMKDTTPIQIRSWGGSGKVQEGDQDGVSFVYTRIPASQNFTLKAKIKVVKWRYEGQEGMGLMATDALGAGNDKDKQDQNSVFVNNYMVGAMRFGNGSLGSTFDKAFKGNKGIGMIQEVGNPNPAVKPATWDYDQINLDPYPEDKGWTSGTYNILGNETDKDGNLDAAREDKGSVKAGFTQADPLVTEFTLEIERNNTGVYGRYYLPNGTVKVAKTWDRDTLLQQDDSAMYVGFFAARHMVIEVSDVDLRVDSPDNYPPAEVPDTTYITPRVKVGTPTFSNTETYNLILTSNVVGTASVSVGGTTKTVELVKQKESDKSTGANDYVTRGEVELPMKNGTNQIQIVFQPAAQEEQGFAPYYELRNTDPVKTSVSVTYQNKFVGRGNLYVSPKGTYGGYGTKEKPLDIYTAVKVAQPGQKVILMEGTYNLTSTITIEKGISGTQSEPIYLMADPEAESRIVLDGSKVKGGIVLKGDYWHFYNFVVQNCGGSGIAVNGSNNVIEYVDVIGNQNTGLQIARGGEVDGVLKYWPSNNLVLNCLAMNNRDESWGSADGFAAKLTSGTGNVFRYCVAAYNADDGWDLFAKSEDGPIGDVIIENCVVYKSGFGLEADGKEITNPNANGNGFKMGGSGVYGNHKVINSYAFYNKAKGVDSNSGPNTEAHNVVSYNNIGPNIRFYTDTSVANTDYAVDNWISFKDDAIKGEIYVNSSHEYDSYSKAVDEVNAKGTQVKSKWENATAYYWNGSETKSTGGTIADPGSLFVSTDLKDLKVGYNEDGNLCTGDFLKLKDDIPANLASVVPSTDPANYHSPENLMVMPDMNDAYFITPDTAFVVPSNTSSGGSRGGEDTDPATGNTVNKRTTANGTTLITVTDPTGEVLVDMSLPASVPTTDKKFVDVADDHWATNAIYEMAGRSIVKGVDDEHFNPNADVTRGTLATMLFRLSNGKEGYPNAFSDVTDGSWYKDAVAWAAKVGVVNGYNNGTFGGNDVITREQLAVMLYRYANLLGLKATKTAELGAFVDGATVSDWAAEGMNWAVANGIINGVGNDTLAPKATATRAQATLMLQRFIALLK